MSVKPVGFQWSSAIVAPERSMSRFTVQLPISNVTFPTAGRSNISKAVLWWSNTITLRADTTFFQHGFSRPTQRVHSVVPCKRLHHACLPASCPSCCTNPDGPQ